MDLDVYQPCPCGSGKKLKFCCSKDILADLDGAIRLLEGEQRLAGVDKLKSLIEKHGPRDALLALSTSVYLEMGEYDRARTWNKDFLASQPNNPLALAHATMLAVSAGNGGEAVDNLMSALENVEDALPYELYETILIVAQVMLSAGNIFGGRSLLMLHAALAGEQDTRALSTIAKINQLPQTSLLMRQDWPLADSPDDAPYAEAFLEGIKSASRGLWRKSLGQFKEINDQHADQEGVIRNMALLQLWLGDETAGRELLHKYAALEGTPHDDAVEAEALAQLLDARDSEGEVENVTLTYALSDLDALTERLTSEDRVVRLQFDPQSFTQNEEVPPKAAFSLLDRKTPEHSDDLTPSDIPLVLGQMLIFGRQTDRDARLEFTGLRRDDFDATLKTLSEVIGDSLGEMTGEEVNDKLPINSVALTWNWRFPQESPPEFRKRLIDEQRAKVLTDDLPNLGFPALGGKTLAEAAAGSAADKIAAEAGVFTIELTGQEQLWDYDFAVLRKKLGLPPASLVHPGEIELMRVPLVRWSRLAVEELDDEQLVLIYKQAVFGQAIKAATVLANEVLRREEIPGVDRAQVHMSLMRMTKDVDVSLDHLLKAREIIVARGESPAMTLIEELSMRLAQGDVETCQTIIQRVQTYHMNEPGVAQTLYQLLSSVGAIDPSTTPPPGAMPGPMPSRAASAQAPGGVWTPDGGGASPPPADAGGGEEKSKLWLPGMD